MKRKDYTPSPVDTAKTIVPDELVKLSERIAENAHDVWAAGRLAEGWTWGPVRDDLLKQHPCLVPYGKLPEQEKEDDRRASMETIRLILALGFEIGRKDKTA